MYNHTRRFSELFLLIGTRKDTNSTEGALLAWLKGLSLFAIVMGSVQGAAAPAFRVDL
jgi:hypothetical protein